MTGQAGGDQSAATIEVMIGNLAGTLQILGDIT